MTHPYDKIVAHFNAAFREIEEANLRDALAKGGVGEILLAHRVGHTLHSSDKGSDGIGSDGKRYEYKVSITDQYNFHFGTRNATDTPEAKVRRHFQGVEGAYCARREGANLVEIIFVPSASLTNHLIEHFRRTTGDQINKNFRLAALLSLNGAQRIA